MKIRRTSRARREKGGKAATSSSLAAKGDCGGGGGSGEREDSNNNNNRRSTTISGSGGGDIVESTGIYDKCDSSKSSSSFRKQADTSSCRPPSVTKLQAGGIGKYVPELFTTTEEFSGPLTRTRSGSFGHKKSLKKDQHKELNESEETTPLILLLAQSVKSEGTDLAEFLKAGSATEEDSLRPTPSTTTSNDDFNKMSENGCKHFQSYVKEHTLDTYRIIDAYFATCINKDAREKKVCSILSNHLIFLILCFLIF